MEQSFDLSDSTDWIDTPLNLLGPLESSLRCQICKDFFTSPVLTSCCHTFCSLCIRRCLSNDQKCPVCRQNDQELKLRRNWQVEEFVENFKKARPNMLELARKEAARIKNGTDRVPEPSVKKRKVDHSDQATEAQPAPSPRRVRTRSRTAQVETDTPPEPEIIEESDGIEVIQDSQDEEEEYVPGLFCEFTGVCPRSNQTQMTDWSNALCVSGKSKSQLSTPILIPPVRIFQSLHHRSLRHRRHPHLGSFFITHPPSKLT